MSPSLELELRARLDFDAAWRGAPGLSGYQGCSALALAADRGIDRGDLSSPTKRRRDLRTRHDLGGQPAAPQPHKAREWTPERREKQRQAMLDHHAERRLSQTKMACYLRGWRAAKRVEA